LPRSEIDTADGTPEPKQPIPAIVKLYQKYSVIAIGEFHGYEELGALYTGLVQCSHPSAAPDERRSSMTINDDPPGGRAF
jgi:hypothetical protein